MTQTAVPVSDVAASTWTTQGGSGSNLYATIDESVASDTDYIESATTPDGDEVVLAFGTLTDPLTNAGHVVRYRYAKDLAGGDQVDLVVTLRNGATDIASWTHTDIDETWNDATQTLAAAEADAITNYSDLRIVFSALANPPSAVRNDDGGAVLNTDDGAVLNG